MPGLSILSAFVTNFIRLYNIVSAHGSCCSRAENIAVVGSSILSTFVTGLTDINNTISTYFCSAECVATIALDNVAIITLLGAFAYAIAALQTVRFVIVVRITGSWICCIAIGMTSGICAIDAGIVIIILTVTTLRNRNCACAG